MDSKGVLYGSTSAGGTDSRGVVFSLAPPAHGQTSWTETVLHDFTGSHDGSAPLAGLVIDKKGNLYGTASTGGAENKGVVFELSPPAAGKTQWTETVLHSFSNGADGGLPSADLTIDGSGALYGTTTHGGTTSCKFDSSAGCGVVFKLTPPAAGQTSWTETVLHSFNFELPSILDGTVPLGGVVVNSSGVIFGTTSNGGSHLLAGVVYRLTPAAGAKTGYTETVAYDFGATGSDGVGPLGNLLLDKAGNLYGTASEGGASSNNSGDIYKLAPAATGKVLGKETVLRSFTQRTDGGGPMAGLAVDKSGAFYGTTALGGAGKCGTVFKLTP